MVNWYLKNTAGQISGTGKQIGKKVAEEPLEIIKNTQSQITQTKDTKKPVQVQTTKQLDNQLSEEDKVKLENERRKRLKEAENQLQEVRKAREEDKRKWQEEQNRLLGLQPQEEITVLEEPTTKPKSHTLGHVKKKQGTREMGRQVSG